MNQYLKKIAESNTRKGVEGVGAVAAGSSAVHHSYKKGLLTGRERLYHGTGTHNVESVLGNGIKPRFKPGPIDMIEKKNPGKSLKSDHLTFMTRDRSQAQNYSITSDVIHDLGVSDLVASQKGDVKAAKKVLESSARHTSKKNLLGKKAPAKDTGVIEGNVPTWNLKERENPEYHQLKNQVAPTFSAQRDIRKTYKDSVFANHGDIPAKYLKESPHYEANSLKEISQYARKAPGRFGKGLALATSGAALIAYGAHKFKSMYGQ